MTEKSIIIVGAGLAGLATGCYAQMNGYKTKIFERQGKPGGVCVSWQRKGYSFDYAVVKHSALHPAYLHPNIQALQKTYRGRRKRCHIWMLLGYLCRNL